MICLAKMTNAQARKRIMEAHQKFTKVYMASSPRVRGRVTTADMVAIDKICSKVISRLKKSE